MPLVFLIGCKSAEQQTMDKVAGTYVRTFREGVDPEPGLNGEVERHVLKLTADGKFTTEHPAQSLQQFDVPFGDGTYRVMNPTTIVLRFEEGGGGPDDQKIMDSQKFTVAGDTLFPQTSERMKLGERVTSISMHVGEKAFLLKQH